MISYHFGYIHHNSDKPTTTTSGLTAFTHLFTLRFHYGPVKTKTFKFKIGKHRFAFGCYGCEAYHHHSSF